MKTLKSFCAELEIEIVSSYTEGVTIEAAERLAAKFLHGQIQVSVALKSADLDARMQKSGSKTIRAAAYRDIVSNSDKKHTVDALENMLNENKAVMASQRSFDEAEVDREELKRYYDIFNNAHIYYRGIAKGNFGG